jgi:predicted Na+-dependent transporter
VVVAAVIGLTAARPLGWLAAHHAISVLLAVLVFATAVTIAPAALRRAGAAWPLLLATVATGITVLPALAWALSWIVVPGPLRDGVLTVGLAPAEIASVAATAMAGGEAAVAAGVLVGSVAATVAAAGPVLALESGRAGRGAPVVHPVQVIASLALVVVLPLAAGLALRAHPATGARLARAAPAANVTATAAVVALVAVIASQVRLSFRYLPVLFALLVFLAASAVLGRLVASRAPRPPATAVLLTISMRDFAIAAGLADAAFGPAAAAPLGLYGILVLAWGTAVAGVLRRRGTGAAGPA